MAAYKILYKSRFNDDFGDKIVSITFGKHLPMLALLSKETEPSLHRSIKSIEVVIFIKKHHNY